MELWRNIRSAGWPLAGSLVTILLLGLLDLLSGLELSFSIFYLLPISWLTWTCGLVPGVFASLLAAAVWLSAEILGGQSFQLAWALYWNTAVRLGLFLLTTVLLDRFKSNQDRRHLLERLFFHDLLNLTGSLRGFTELLRDENLQDKKEVTRLLAETTERIIDEIETQRILSAAESGELPVQAEYLQTRLLLEALMAIYRHHHCAAGRSLVLDEPIDESFLRSDPTLLTRILGNMIKNALEATPPAGTVLVGCRAQVEEIIFSVNNPGEMPAPARKKAFRETASTKGRGRGLGLRSIRLLASALGGAVELTSGAEEGTTVLLRLQKSGAADASPSQSTD